MHYKIKKPNIEKVEKRFPQGILDERGDEIFDFIKRINEPEYLPWDKVQYKKPRPKGVDPETLWLIAKVGRQLDSMPTPIADADGRMFTAHGRRFFTWVKLSGYDEVFHNFDLNTGGQLATTKGDIDLKRRQRFISRGIMEEAIASSQLEGAITSIRVAKKMIREGRKPRNRSEQMIMNSYLTMRAMEDDYKDRDMSMDLISEFHGMITRDTKTEDGETPRMRNKKDKIHVSDKVTGVIYHEAPDIRFVKKELEKLVSFANDELPLKYFIHPVVRGILLHFWIGYLHPFTDGNGRLARLLFYWYLLRQDYWAFAYLPISTIIRKSPIQYAMAFVYSEQDDNDLTYFIDYHIRKIKQAMKEFDEYVQRKEKENVTMSRRAKAEHKFNERQIQVLQYLYGAPDERTNVTTHINIFQVAKMTATKDLKQLAEKSFLTFQKEGRNVYYYPTKRVRSLFAKR